MPKRTDSEILNQMIKSQTGSTIADIVEAMVWGNYYDAAVHIAKNYGQLGDEYKLAFTGAALNRLMRLDGISIMLNRNDPPSTRMVNQLHTYFRHKSEDTLYTEKFIRAYTRALAEEINNTAALSRMYYDFVEYFASRLLNGN